jgi:hypothetical protein
MHSSKIVVQDALKGSRVGPNQKMIAKNGVGGNMAAHLPNVNRASSG